MAQDILIKGSAVTATPAVLLQRELAYSEDSDNLFIGTAAGVQKIGGKSDVDKLALIEALADVTDAVNVAGAGAVMASATDASAFGFVLDEDNFVSDSATKVPTQQSVKAYVAQQLTGGMTYEGSYNAATNTPDLTTAPTVSQGSTYSVTVAGTFFGEAVEVGDVLVAEIANPTVVADWTILNKNITSTAFVASVEKGVANGVATLDANSEVSQLPAGAAAATAGFVLSQDGTWVAQTAGSVDASETVKGVIELATQAEVDTGVDTVRAVTPATLSAFTIDGGTF